MFVHTVCYYLTNNSNIQILEKQYLGRISLFENFKKFKFWTKILSITVMPGIVVVCSVLHNFLLEHQSYVKSSVNIKIIIFLKKVDLFRKS